MLWLRVLRDANVRFSLSVSFTRNTCCHTRVRVQRASASASGRQEFVTQFDQIVASLGQTRARLEAKQATEQRKRDAVSRSYQELIERQRLYQRVIEKFRKECSRHEVLTDSMRLRSQQQQQELLQTRV